MFERVKYLYRQDQNQFSDKFSGSKGGVALISNVPYQMKSRILSIGCHAFVKTVGITFFSHWKINPLKFFILFPVNYLQISSLLSEDLKFTKIKQKGVNRTCELKIHSGVCHWKVQYECNFQVKILIADWVKRPNLIV